MRGDDACDSDRQETRHLVSLHMLSMRRPGIMRDAQRHISAHVCASKRTIALRRGHKNREKDCVPRTVWICPLVAPV